MNQEDKLFCNEGEHLILIKEAVDSKGNVIASPGEEFFVENIIGFGFDLVNVANPELNIRVINSDMVKYFELKNYS